MSGPSGPGPSNTPQLTLNVVLLPESDQRALLVTTSQLNAIIALLGLGQLEVTA